MQIIIHYIQLMVIVSVIIITNIRSEACGRKAVVIGQTDKFYYAIDIEPIMRETRKYAPRPFYTLKKSSAKKIPISKMDPSFRKKANLALIEGKKWLLSKKAKEKLEPLPMK